MSYKKNYHEVEVSGKEMENILKDWAIDDHNVAVDEAPPPTSHNQVIVEVRDTQNQLVNLGWIKIRWNI